MAGDPVRMVGLGVRDRSDCASAILESSIELGSDAQFIIERNEISEFDHGLIDWRRYPRFEALARAIIILPP